LGKSGNDTVSPALVVEVGHIGRQKSWTDPSKTRALLSRVREGGPENIAGRRRSFSFSKKKNDCEIDFYFNKIEK